MHSKTAIFTLLAISVCLIGSVVVLSEDGDAVTGTAVDQQSLESYLNTEGTTYVFPTGDYYLDGDLTNVSHTIAFTGTSTFDLNGHTISSTAGNAVAVVGGQLTVNDGSEAKTGKVSTTANGYALLSQGELIVNGGTFEGPFALGNATGDDYTTVVNGGTFNGTSIGAVANDDGVMTINGGKFTGQYAVQAQNGGTITIKDADIDGTVSGIMVCTDYRLGDATVTIDGGTIDGPCGILVYGGSSILYEAVLVVNGGTITGTQAGISGNGLEENAYTDITINNGTVKGGIIGIYHPQIGDMTVNGGSITGGSTGIEIRMGTLTVTGGTVTSESTTYEVSSNTSGSTTTGAAIAVAPYASATDDCTIELTVYDGTFTGAVAFSQSNPNKVSGAGYQFQITGGTFTSNATDPSTSQTYPAVKAESTVERFITGGSYTGGEGTSDFIDSNYTLQKGEIVLDSSVTAVATIDGKGYASIWDALMVADDGDTINVEDDCSMSEMATLINKTIILNLNGHTITTSAKIQVEDGSSLTINDTGNGAIEGTVDQMINVVGGSLTINGGTLSTTERMSVRLSSGGTFVMTGGTIDAQTTDSSYGVYIAGGSATITGGTILATDSDQAVHSATSNLIIGTQGSSDGPTVSSVWANQTFTYYSGSIGTLKNSLQTVDTIYGTFGSDVSSYLPAGYHCVLSDDGRYSIEKLSDTNAAASIDGTYYATLAAAGEAVQDGQTIVVLKDYVSDSPFSVQAFNATVDLNGHTITVTGNGQYGVSVNPSNHVDYDDSKANSVTVRNGTIVADTPMYAKSGNNMYVNLVIGDGLTLIAGNGPDILLSQEAYVKLTETSEDLTIAGYKAIAADGTEYIYGRVGDAMDVDADKTVDLMHNSYESITMNVAGDWTVNLNGWTVDVSGVGIRIGASNASLTVNNGNIVSTDSGAIAWNDSSSATGQDTHMSLTLNDVHITSGDDFAVYAHGNNKGTDITINGGSVKATDGWGVYFPSTGTVSITDAEISGITGIEMRAGTLNIGGSTKVTTTVTDYSVSQTPDSGGSTVRGAAIAISPYSTSVTGGSMTVSIESGEFNGAVAFAQAHADETAVMPTFDFSISGGNFTSTGKDESGETYPAIVTATDESGNSEVTESFVTGGTFSGDVSDYMSEGIETTKDPETGDTIVSPPVTIAESEVTVLTTTYQIVASYYASADINYTSDNDNFKVDGNGEVTITGTGTATITASVTVGGTTYTDTIKLTYDDSNKLTSQTDSVEFNAVIIQPDDDLTGRYGEVKDLPEGLEMNAEGWTFIDVKRTDGENGSATFRLTDPGLTEGKRFVIVHFGDTVDYPEYEVGDGYVDVTATSFSPFAYIVYDEYTITFEGEGVNLEPMTVPAGSDIPYSKLPEPSREGYLFMGWTENGVAVDGMGLTDINENHTLTATWILEIEVTVSLSGTLYEGGTITATIEAEYTLQEGQKLWYMTNGYDEPVETNVFTISTPGEYMFFAYVIQGELSFENAVAMGYTERTIPDGETPVDPDDPSTDPDTPVEPAPGWDDDESLPPMPPASTSDSDDGSVTIVACAAAAVVAALMAVFLIVTYRKD